MKRFFFLASLFVLLLAGCSSNDDPVVPEKEEIRFNVRFVRNPDYVATLFESPDPGCGVPKVLRVYTTTDENEIIIECPNYELKSVTYSLYTHQDLRPEDIGVSATIVDAHSYKINLAELTDNFGQNYYKTVFFTVRARRLEDNGDYTEVSTEMDVIRVAVLPDFPDWLTSNF